MLHKPIECYGQTVDDQGSKEPIYLGASAHPVQNNKKDNHIRKCCKGPLKTLVGPDKTHQGGDGEDVAYHIDHCREKGNQHQRGSPGEPHERLSLPRAVFSPAVGHLLYQTDQPDGHHNQGNGT